MDQQTLVIIKCLLALLLGFIISFTLEKYLIRRARKKELYQTIRDDIVSTHQKKNHTPTLGGIGIFLGALISFVIVDFNGLQNQGVFSILIIMISYFLIGFYDDYRKVRYHDSKGMSASIRFFLEIFIALAVLIFLNYQDSTTWRFHLTFPRIVIDIGLWFLLLFPLMIVGSANAVNLSDGLDGLASLLMLVALMPFVTIALSRESYSVAFLLCALFGSLIGFIPSNLHPAKIFMGDCGSLMLGGVLAISAIILNAEGSLLVAGAIFVIETLSVIIQVSYFKLTHKRIFRMAPLHHHFEMKGVAEWKVVMAFMFVAVTLSFVALIIGVGL